MFRKPVFLLLFIVGLFVLPAYAYGDPTGGMLFQILMPTLAAIWGMWMILANNLRKRVTRLVRRLRGIDLDESAAEHPSEAGSGERE